MSQAAEPTPSEIVGLLGKGPGDENFPVASILIARRLRPHVMSFYTFARSADDIADHSGLNPTEKLRRLDEFEAGLTAGTAAPDAVARLRDNLAEAGMTDRYARDLLSAFRQDVSKSRYADWGELLDYCALSANPVGRFLLDLHGEARSTHGPGDALCAALQILNHLQDCNTDKQELDRVYLPGNWMSAAGVDATALDASVASPGLRRVIDQCLDGCDQLLNKSEPLAGLIRARRLATEVAVTHRLARRLAARLRHEDPLARQVKHSRLDLLVGLVAGLQRIARL